MNFQTKYTTGKNKNIEEALKMISVHEWIWIGFVPFCFLAIGINSLLAPIDDSYVQIAILLFAASLVLFGLSFSKILKTNLGLMKRLDEMGPPGTEIVFTINKKEIIVEKVSGEKREESHYEMDSFPYYFENMQWIVLFNEKVQCMVYIGSLSLKEKLEMDRFLNAHHMQRKQKIG